jgi:cytochrome c-type biogenesis protein CcmH
MSWVLAIALAGAVFALAIVLFRVARQAWSALAATLALGLAGYALQASPGLPGAPAASRTESDLPGETLKQARQAMVGPDQRSRSGRVLTADAFATRGQYADAAALLRGAVAENPRDSEAWLALGNVLVEHAEGRVTEPALFAYRRASEADPRGIGAGYFLGLSLLRQGSIIEGRNIWAETLAQAPEDAAGRAMLAEQLNRLDVLLRQAAEAAAQ